MESVDPVWTVYFHSDDWQTPGRNTLMNDIFELLKLENVATHEGFQPISPAVILDLEPDLIIADSVSSVVLNPALSGLHMVQDPSHIRHHIFVLSDDHSFSIDSHSFPGRPGGVCRLCVPGGIPPGRRKQRRDIPMGKEGNTLISWQSLGTPGEHIEIVEYNADWPLVFEREAAAILAACRPLITDIHHIGSTSTCSRWAIPKSSDISYSATTSG